MMINTPPMAATDRSPSEDAFYVHSYFSKTYEPLSSLPTPPRSANTNGQVTPPLEVNDGLDPMLLGAAIHLKNLIPSSVSLLDPSIHIVHSILVRAKLPLSTIALAVCILDCLNSKFARSWRQSSPLRAPDGPSRQEPHVDPVRPEVIVLAALIISVKFLDDEESTTQSYAENWGSMQWRCEHVNASLHCILENLQYSILPLWTEELIAGALDDIETAGKYAGGSLGATILWTKDLELKTSITSQAGWSENIPVTPAETPTSESIGATLTASPKTRQPLGPARGDSGHPSKLPKVTVTEFFPAYSEPILEDHDTRDGSDVRYMMPHSV